MIRLIQRRLIIPRGDTGTFTVPVLATKNTGDVAVFSIIDTMTDKKVFEKIVNVSGDTMTIEFSHYDTVNLPVGKYVWDIKFYQNPEFMDGVLVNGVEVDSYYAAFTMPICEIRQTGDNLLMADDAPGTELTPDQLDILNAAVNETNAAKSQANESAASANIAATTAADKADEATAKAEEATTALNELKEILPTLAEVATSGSYNDLEDKPFIPSKVSDLTDDSGHYIKPTTGIPASDLEETYLTEHQDLSNYVQKTDYATTDNAGIVKINAAGGIGINKNSHALGIVPSSETDIKNGTEFNRPIVPYYQHTSAFYGLAKAAGDTTQSQSNNTVGTYTDSAKTAIQQMLGVPSTAAIPTAVSQLQNDSGYLTSFTETDPTVPAWAKASTKPTYTAAEVGAPTVQEMTSAISTAIGNVNSFDMAVVQELPTQDISTHTIYLVPKTGETNDVYDEYVYINNAWEMVGNTQIDLSNYVQKTDYATETDAGVIRVSGNYGLVNVSKQDVITGEALTYTAVMEATANNIKEGTDRYRIISSRRAPNAIFYGLAKAAGDSTQSQSNNAIGTYTDEAKAAIQTMLDVPSKSEIPDVPVTDVQVNGVSVLQDGVANVPVAANDGSVAGVIKLNNYGVTIFNGHLYLQYASGNEIKAATTAYRAVTPSGIDAATFYGLAKAAGDTTQKALPYAVGQYTDDAKSAIQSMLGITQMLAPENPNMTAAQAYEVGEVFAANGKLYKATAAIAQDGAIIPAVEGEEVAGANCEETSVGDGFPHDVQVNGTSVVSNGVANVPIAKRYNDNGGALGVISVGQGLTLNSSGMLFTDYAKTDTIKSGANYYQPITPINEHQAAFYGLAKAAGDATQAASDNAVGTYTDDAKAAIRTMLGAVGDVQVNGTSVVTNGVAVIPIAFDGSYGLVKPTTTYGVTTINGYIGLRAATDTQIKEGTAVYATTLPNRQHAAAFYGLAKAAGDTTQSASSNAIGTYTDNAKASIKSMLGIIDGSTGTVDVTGATPTINAVENTRYVCGEVTSLNFTPPASGISIVRFTSGSSVTVLTIPSTVKFPEWFDPTALETNTIYEICVTDGEFGAVMSWAL